MNQSWLFFDAPSDVKLIIESLSKIFCIFFQFEIIIDWKYDECYEIITSFKKYETMINCNIDYTI